MRKIRTRPSLRWVMRLAQKRLITFLIGNRQYCIYRPFLISTFANQLFFYLLLLFCMTIYLQPTDVFIKTSYAFNIYRLFIIVALFQMCLLIAGFALSVILHVSLAKGNTNYRVARAKRLVFHLLTSIRSVYAFGSSFSLLYNILQHNVVSVIVHVIVLVLSILYFVAFNYMSLFYASTTLVLSPMQYLLITIMPEIVAFIMGPLYMIFICSMSSLASWMIASRYMHTFIFSFLVYNICANCLAPFCSFLCLASVAISCFLSGINLVGIIVTIVPMPTNYFVIYINIVTSWTAITFSICYFFVTRKYRREQAAIVRLHNGNYTFADVCLTPEMLYNSLLVFISYVEQVTIADVRLYVALENICLCYIIALYDSLRLESNDNSTESHDDRGNTEHHRGCISKCSKQKKFAYICLILDILDCEVLHTFLDAPKEDDSKENLYRTITSTNQDRRIIYEINTYLLETFSFLMLCKSMTYKPTGYSTILDSDQSSSDEPRILHIQDKSVNKLKADDNHDYITATGELQDIQRYEKIPLDLGVHTYEGYEEVAKSSTILTTQQYRRDSTRDSVDKAFPLTIDLSDVGQPDLNNISFSESVGQFRPISSMGKDNAMSGSNANMLSYESNGPFNRSHMPFHVYRYSTEIPQGMFSGKKRRSFSRWSFSIYQDSRNSKDILTNSITDLKDRKTKFHWIIKQLSPQFLQDLVFDSSERKGAFKSNWHINSLLETLLYSCCGFLFVKTKDSNKHPKFKRIFDPSRLFYLDETPPQEMYKHQNLSSNQSGVFGEPSDVIAIASPYLSSAKDVSIVFNEQINPDVTPLSTMKQFHGLINKSRRFKHIKYLDPDNMYDSIYYSMNRKGKSADNIDTDFLNFAPPTNYKYFASPRLTNTRPMNLCSCMIINSILTRILESADTCLTNIDRITNLSNNLKRDLHFSTVRLEELMVLCHKQNVMYQDIVEQAKKLYVTYPQCVTATHTLAWVYHELYNTIWPLNQLSIFPLIDHIYVSLTDVELSNLNNSLLHSNNIAKRTNLLSSDSSDEEASPINHETALYNLNYGPKASVHDIQEDLRTIHSNINDESDDKPLLTLSARSQQVSNMQQIEPTTGTFSTLSLSSFGQTHTKSVLLDHLSHSSAMQNSYDVSVKTVRNYISNFILSQDHSVQSFYIAYTLEGSVVILPPCLSYCHYEVIDSPLSLQRCEHRTYSDIKEAEASLGVSPVSINIINQMAILSATTKTSMQNKARNQKKRKEGTHHNFWRRFFTTGFSNSLTTTKASAKKVVKTLLNKHQDIIRPITMFNLENFTYIVAFLIAFVISIVVIIRANRVFLYSNYVKEAASVFATIVQTDEIHFIDIYDRYSQRLANKKPTEELFTIDELHALYYLSTSNVYESLSQNVYNLGLDLEQYAFSSIHPFFHVLKVSNKMVSFIATPVPMRVYGTIVFQNPYSDIHSCYPDFKALDMLGLQDVDNRRLVIMCIQEKIEIARSNVYINLVPFIWNILFTMTTSSLLIQNFSTHFKVLLMALACIVGFSLVFALSSYNVFLVRLQNLSDLLLNLLSRTGARFDYRLLFAQFYFKERVNFACQNVKYTPTFEQLLSLHSEAITAKDTVTKGCSSQLSFEKQSKLDTKFRIPVTVETDNNSFDGSPIQLSSSNSAGGTNSLTPNKMGKQSSLYNYKKLVDLYKRFSAKYDKPTAVWIVAKLFILVCIGISMVLLYIFHSFPIISYTETGLGPYYASVIKSVRYPDKKVDPIIYGNEWTEYDDDYVTNCTTAVYRNIGDMIKFEKCLQKAANSTERYNCQVFRDYVDNCDHIAYASPQWRLTWLRENYALFQDLILDTLLTDLSISQHSSLTPDEPGTETYNRYHTCSKAVMNPHLAPFDLDGDIRFADITKKLIYLYTMSLRSPTYDYYSMLLSQYSNIASKYIMFVLDYSSSPNPPSTFIQEKYKAALLLPSFSSYKPMLNQQDLQKTTIGIKAFIELQKNVYNNSFSILQPSYTELKGKDSCAELTAFHSVLLMNSIAKQKDSTSTNNNLDEKNITTEHLFSLALLLSFAPISLLILHYFYTPKAKRSEDDSIKDSVWVDLRSYEILHRIFIVLASLIAIVVMTIIAVSFTQYFSNEVTISHMTRIYVSTSQLNSLGLQLIESLGTYNMKIANLEWDNDKNAYKYNCGNVYVDLQFPIMLNTQFHLVDAVDSIKELIDTDKMLELYYSLRHAAFSVNIALARMCVLPKEIYSINNQESTADVYLDEVFKFSEPKPGKKYSSYYKDYLICIDQQSCIKIYSYAKLKTLNDQQLHAYIQSISQGSNILLKTLLSFSHKVELIVTSLTRQILATETQINNFLVLMQRVIAWLLVVHIILLTLLYVYIQFAPTRNGLVVFKLMTTRKHSLALYFGLTVGSFIILIVILLTALLFAIFRTSITTADGKKHRTETKLYNTFGNAFINSHLMNVTLAILQNTDLTYEEVSLSELYTRIQNLNEYAKIAQSAATMLLPGFSYQNKTGTYDVKDLLLNYTTGILTATEDVLKKIWDKATSFGQRIKLSDVYDKNDYLGVTTLDFGDIQKILETYVSPSFNILNVKIAVGVVYGFMIGGFLAYTTYIIVIVRREISSILTIVNTIPVADILSLKEMSSGIFDVYSNILSFAKLM